MSCALQAKPKRTTLERRESRNPGRNLPLAIGIAVVSVGIFYMLFTAAVYHAVPWQFIAEEARHRDLTAPGLLGYLLQFNGTEEWLHLVFNVVYLASLYALVVPLRRLTPAVIPPWAFAVFLFGSVWLETWHVVEHGVIISHVIANGGCPCPGIADSALGVSDTIVHFFYNLISYGGVVTAYSFVLRRRQATRGPVFTGLRSRR